MTPGEIAFDIMDAIRACLCTALADTTAGPVCRCSVIPGTIAVADSCTCRTGRKDCGTAWVRLDRIYPYDRFPAVATTGDSARCGKPLAAVIEVGVFRCAPGPGPGGTPPAPDALANAARTQVEDSGALAAALSCCAAVTDRTHTLGTYQPRDGGDCIGGIWPLTVALVRR